MPSSAYSRALGELFAARRFGVVLGLTRMRECIERLGVPRAPHSVQIGGTNGKGTTAHFVASVLRRAGVSVGVFSSPHLLSVCERFRIDGQPVSRGDFLRAYDAVRPWVGEATFFERVTAIAAWLFADARVEVAIYEVGLGGRLDSTTGLPADIGVVTGIGFDHCEFLGSSLEEIAVEKAGIFRPGGQAIVGLSAPLSIREILDREARNRGATVQWVCDEHRRQVPRLAAVGEHQRENAAAAVAVLEVLKGRGVPMDEASVRDGLAGARLMGRLHRVAGDWWVDGAHNGQAARGLAAATAKWEPGVLMVALSKKKEIEAFLGPLRSSCRVLIVTEASSERAQNAGRIAEVAITLGFACVYTEPDFRRALATARRCHVPGTAMLATGSLFLVADVLATLGYGPIDPLVVSDPGYAR